MQSYILVYDGLFGLGITASMDLDWAFNPAMRWSQTGYFLKLANGIFSWRSHIQHTIALSSTEAESMALSNCSRQSV